MPPKGRRKKKNAPPPLVAPEPAGDELEVDMLWDCVKEVDDKPPFMDGSVLDATRACFEGEKGHKGTGEAARTAFFGRTRHLLAPRACPQFLASEKELQKTMENAKKIQEDVSGFELLKENEREEAQRKRERVNMTARNLIKELSDTRLTLLEDMEEIAEGFFSDQKQMLERVCNLAVKDNEVEAAFLEQQTMQQLYRDAEERYFTDHGEHVVLIAEMQAATRQQQEEMLQLMLQRLDKGVVEMTKLSVEELEDKASAQEEMSRLIVELLKVQGRSVVLEKETTAITEQMTVMQRMIALELQKQQFCIRRQKQLREELQSLSAKVRENEMQLIAMKSNNTPSAAYTATLPMMPVSPNTIASLTETEGKRSVALLTIEAQRHLEASSAELANYRDELWALRRQHLVQLSGQYQSFNLDNSLFGTTKELYLDADTKAAVRSIVVEALMQVNHILGMVDDTANSHGNLERLLSVVDLRDRRIIQNYVANRINTLFSRICPTAPPLLFLREAANVQSEI
ncbi:hypothetical protein MOQ_001434 [Trypanosoma cruzi marinkellei]|uniref:Uncharacterized protein n=1 Tax=Trypanosoma cruzi marinkellei TaxID=85056 RepID=K2PB76_TRYCR|nr:hypothetical protein MOQ_001434 [Trypanosoma cruzi marinkellei]